MLARLPRPSCATGNRGNCFEDSGGRSCLRTLWQKLSRRSLGSYRAWNILGRLASSMALICRRNSILLRAFLTTASLALPVVPGMRGVVSPEAPSSCSATALARQRPKHRRRPKPALGLTSLTT